MQRLVENSLVLERYKVRQRIATGGLSTVYLGSDVRLKRDVCIKVFRLPPKCTDPQARAAARAQFVNEAHFLGQLRHPGTLRIFDFGYLRWDGGSTPVQIYEHMNGGTLASHVRTHGAMPIDDILAVVRAIAGSLSEMHGAGIVHRDVKPQNVLFAMVDGQLLVKLGDLGAATTVEADREREANAGRFGWLHMYSLDWAAPEQLLGMSVTAAADTFSLGLMLGLMLAGEPLLRAKNIDLALAQRRRFGRLVAKEGLRLGLTTAVVELLAACCAYDPRARPSATALCDELALRCGGQVVAPRWIAPLTLFAADTQQHAVTAVEIPDAAGHERMLSARR